MSFQHAEPRGYHHVIWIASKCDHLIDLPFQRLVLPNRWQVLTPHLPCLSPLDEGKNVIKKDAGDGEIQNRCHPENTDDGCVTSV